MKRKEKSIGEKIGPLGVLRFETGDSRFSKAVFGSKQGMHFLSSALYPLAFSFNRLSRRPLRVY